MRLYTEGICLLLESDPAVEVVGVVSSHQQALEQVDRLHPDVALIDSAMPESLDLVRAMRETAGTVRIVALGLSELDHDILDCAEAGASGYVTRDGSRLDLVAAILALPAGKPCALLESLGA